MVATVLLIACLVELVCTVWCLARLKGFVGRIDALETNVNRAAKVMADLSHDATLSPAVDEQTIIKPTPEELQQASDILKALGLADVASVSDE